MLTSKLPNPVHLDWAVTTGSGTLPVPSPTAVASVFCVPVSTLVPDPLFTDAVASAARRTHGRLPAETLGVDPVLRAGCRAARVLHTPNDRYVLPDSPWWWWFRRVPSGTGAVVLGPNLLWGWPRMLVGSGVPARAIAEFWRTYGTGRVWSRQMTLAGTPVRVAGSGGMLRMDTANAA